MREMVRVCDEVDLPREGQVCEMANGRLCVARIGGQISVLDNACPHNDGPLGQGMIENGRVICPYHAWAFDLKTGEEFSNPNAKVHVYEAEVRDGALMVRPQDFSA
jgi:nitrite reductase (NADH) small subunit